MPAVSLIVPVYNVENYLSSCVDSILAQTCTDFECILVDDGSQDGSARLCDAYASRDARIRVVHQANAGVSSARNAGIQVARGEWVTFVDADDCIHPEYLQLLLTAAETHNAQMACCSHQEIAEDAPLEDKGHSGTAWVLSGAQAVTEHYQHSRFPFTVWGKLYARSLMEYVRFPDGLNHEDEFFNNHVLLFYSTVVLITESLYGYRLRQNSFMRTTFSKSRLDIFTVNHDAFMFFKEQGLLEVLPFVSKEFWRRFHHYGRRAVKQHCLTPAWERQLLSYCHDLLNAHFPPKHPLIHIFVRLFVSPHGRPIFYWFYSKL